ncbi:hypothetical protein HQO27_19850 [Rhodococcus fascians]|nr:hypothetical protein [Rhodococcus fascians]MBY4235878.1 hypothetical protein [Rhodococcus fascians]MBY4251569.1 hypothetical protein [Rhodococcus fascians]MBY4267224.1 hypothetical protein [Rhodococcus fascians]MBY4275310.1 hypothetical protein [Rhodococcus fascians]
MTDEKSLGRRVDDVYRRPSRRSLLPQDAIPLLSRQIAAARESTSSDAVRTRADEVLEQLAVLYSARSSPQ